MPTDLGFNSEIPYGEAYAMKYVNWTAPALMIWNGDNVQP
jgi:hypothetical protein